jgi:hypothetical protein
MRVLAQIPGGNVNIGGAEGIMEQHARKVEIATKVDEMAKEGQEFVFTKEEDVENMFFCTACKRGVVALNRGIVGRISTESQSYKAAKKKVTSVIDNICVSSARLKKDPPVLKGCEKFVKVHKKALVKAFMPRVDEDHDNYEEFLDSDKFCQMRTTACPEGVLSFDELVGDRLLDRETDVGKKHVGNYKMASKKAKAEKSSASDQNKGTKPAPQARKESAIRSRNPRSTSSQGSSLDSTARRSIIAKLRRQLMSEL